MSIAVAVPGLLALVGAGAGNAVAWLVSRRQAHWREREEAMRLLRWAAELAGDSDPRVARTGIAALGGLMESPLVDPDDIDLMFRISQAARLHSVEEEEEVDDGE